jgi:hypothetical protein
MFGTIAVVDGHERAIREPSLRSVPIVATRKSPLRRSRPKARGGANTSKRRT